MCNLNKLNLPSRIKATFHVNYKIEEHSYLKLMICVNRKTVESHLIDRLKQDTLKPNIIIADLTFLAQNLKFKSQMVGMRIFSITHIMRNFTWIL